jgi:hypothetical protein
MGSTVINYHGSVRGRIIGDTPNGDEVLDRAGAIGSAIWGGPKKAEGEGGPLSSVIVSYQKFRVIGVPIPGTKIAVVVTAGRDSDPVDLVNRIAYFVQYHVGRTPFDSF